VSQLMLHGRREWDEQLIRECMYNHDALEVLQIRLSDKSQEDQIAWALEKSGIFLVKSAYRLALNIDWNTSARACSSASPDGSCTLYKDIWSANVPQKVKIFAWRLAQEVLTTQLNRTYRKLEENGRCQICGAEDESAHHAVIRCTRVVSL
jgi:hypothetical protein